jgi:hypothetical protein
MSQPTIITLTFTPGKLGLSLKSLPSIPLPNHPTRFYPTYCVVQAVTGKAEELGVKVGDMLAGVEGYGFVREGFDYNEVIQGGRREEGEREKEEKEGGVPKRGIEEGGIEEDETKEGR